MQERALTIPELFAERGFATGGIFNYWYFDKSTGLTQGFSHYDNKNRSLHRSSGGKGLEQTKGTSSKQQTDKAIEYVAKHASQRFLLWVHYYDPHYAYERHPEVSDFGDQPVDLYDNEIRFTDMQIGRLVDELKARSLYDKTAIVITGDHGEGFGEHNVKLHGYELYAAQTKVPFIIRVPGLSPRVVSMPTGHIDILPTLANLLGAPPNPQMQGRSLLDVIAGTAPADADRWVFQQLSHGPHHELRAAASLHCHVLFNASPQNSWELYRIDEDPLEEREISGNPGTCAGAVTHLQQWYEQSELEQADMGSLQPDALQSGSLDIEFGDAIRLHRVELPTEPRAPSGAARRFELVYELSALRRLEQNVQLEVAFSAMNGGQFSDTLRPNPGPESWTVDETVRVAQPITVPSTVLRGRYIAWVSVRLGGRPLIPSTDNPAVLLEGDHAAAVGAIAVHR